MAEVVHSRESALRRTLQELTIQIDEAKRARQVAGRLGCATHRVAEALGRAGQIRSLQSAGEAFRCRHTGGLNKQPLADTKRRRRRRHSAYGTRVRSALAM